MTKRYTETQNKQWLATLPKKMLVVKLILHSDKGNILIVKPDYKDAWQLPGGGVEAREDPKDALVRELREELNFSIDAAKAKLINSVYKQNEEIVILIYEYATSIPEATPLKLQNDESEKIEAVQYVPLGEVGQHLSLYYGDFWRTYESSRAG